MPQPTSHAVPSTDRWQDWDVFLERSADAGFMQSSWWADFRMTCGYETSGVVVRQQGAIVGGAIVHKFHHADDACFYYLPDGPLLPADESLAADVFETILAGLDEQRRAESPTVSHLRVEPRWRQVPAFVRGFVAARRDRFREPRYTLYMDLRPSEPEILAQMKPKGRYNIGLGQRHGVSVAEDTTERGLADFLAIYDDTAERQGFGAKPTEYFEDLFAMLVPLRRCALFFAEYRGVRLAAALVVYFGKRATYFFGGSLATERHTMAPYVLHFEIMRRTRAAGYEWYDLWGIAAPEAPDDPLQDITVFKRKFGGSDVALVPTLDLVYDAAAYADYSGRSEAMQPAPLAGEVLTL